MDLKSETGSKSFLALELKVLHISDFCLKSPLSNCCSASPPGLNFSQAGDLGLLVLVTWESAVDRDQIFWGLMISNTSSPADGIMVLGSSLGLIEMPPLR